MREAVRRGILTVESIPVYPALLAIAFVVEPFTAYDLEPRVGLRALAIAAMFGIMVTVLLAALFGRHLGGALAALAVMAFVAATTLPRAVVFLGPVFVLLLERHWAARGTLRWRLPWSSITRLLNVGLVTLLAVEAASVAEVKLTAPPVPMSPAWNIPVAPGARPDIFLILMDAHARADVIADSYTGNANALGDGLHGLGFDLSPSSHANHSFTRFSVSVLLNGRPIAELGQDMDAPANEQIPLATLRSPGGIALARAAGYDTVYITSPYEHARPRGADVIIDSDKPNELEIALLEGTLGGRLFDTLTAGRVAEHRERVLEEFEQLQDLARHPSARPQFVWAHIPTPHQPLAFNQDCSLRPEDEYTTGRYVPSDGLRLAIVRPLVRDQTACVDRLLLDAVGTIVKARPNAVVVVLSDHGPDDDVDWSRPSQSAMADRMRNLFWARTPGRPSLFRLTSPS